MARISFVDELSRRGEMELAQVHAGDLVRFSDFLKYGDGRVDKDELGEVISISPQAPALVILAPIARGRETKDEEIAVLPDEVVVLVDSRDPRVGTHRIEGWRLRAVQKQPPA